MNNSKILSISLTKYIALSPSNDNTRLISAQLLIKNKCIDSKYKGGTVLWIKKK